MASTKGDTFELLCIILLLELQVRNSIDIPFAASTAILSLRAQFIETFLLFEPVKKISFRFYRMVSSQRTKKQFSSKIAHEMWNKSRFFFSITAYHKGFQPRIHQADIHRLKFAAWIHNKILPMIQDFDGELETKGKPAWTA